MNDALRYLLALAGLGCVSAQGAAIDENKLPPPAAQNVDFARDIQPIFEKSCLRCHGPERPKGSFRLDDRELALEGGDGGASIIPGESGKSPLIHYVARLVEGMEMPPADKGEPLTALEVGLLRAWIDQGVVWPESEAKSRVQFSITPVVRWFSVEGNEAKFREHQWMREGWSGGVQEFKLWERIGKDQTLTVEGHSLFDDSDARLALRYEKAGVGFGAAGVEHYRKYFDDTGGYYAPFATPALRLDRDLYLNHGRAWVDFGLTLPDWPQITLGYEYQWKDGASSTLQWGSVDPGTGDSRKIYPASKDVSEGAHILKLDVFHEMPWATVEDNLRIEFYDLQTQRNNAGSYSLATGSLDKFTLATESRDHFQAANAVRLEKQVNDWLFLSGGYLYSHFDGEAAFSMSTVAPAGGLTPDDKYWFSNRILLEQHSHIFNVNTMLGPWDGLTVSLGVQNEWMWQRGLGDVRLDEGILGDPLSFFAVPAALNSDIDRGAIDETAAVRYTKIPFTVLFAEGRMQQESIGQFEDQTGGRDFLRDTDASGDLKEGRLGFTFSPWPTASLTSHYKRRIRKNAYDHLSDSNFGLPTGEGYSAFIRSRETDTDEFLAKLTLKPASWLRASLSYQLIATDYETATDAFVIPEFPPFPEEVIAPGGSLFAGNYDAHVYALNATLTPWRRLYISESISWRNTRTSTAQDGSSIVASYEGDVFSTFTSARYILNEKTDLNAGYTFSWADYGQENEIDGLPLGIVYDWHGATLGITRRFRENVTGSAQYRFYHYDEPSSGSANDYIAHGIFASLHWAFR